MGAALIVATQINFKYDPPSEQPAAEPSKAPQELTREEYLQQQLAQQLNLPSLADTSAGVPQKEPNVGKVRKVASGVAIDVDKGTRKYFRRLFYSLVSPPRVSTPSPPLLAPNALIWLRPLPTPWRHH